MSRRARLGEDEKAKWSMIKQWTLMRGYSAYRAQQAVPPGTLVIVMHQRLADDGTDLAHPERHPLLAAQTLLRRLLLKGAGDSSTNQPLSMPPLILVLDVSELAPNEKAMEKMLDAECSTIETKTKKTGRDEERVKKCVIGKSTARQLEKLSLQDATLVACGKGCQLLLKLLLTGERGAGADGSWKRLVLLHPILPASTINGILTPAHSGGSLKGTAKNVPVDVVFASEAAQAKRGAILRASFPLGTSLVLPCDTTPDAMLALVAPALLGKVAAADATELEFDPEHMDALGRTVWLGKLEIILSPFTKQFEQSATDMTAEMREHWRCMTAASEKVDSACESTPQQGIVDVLEGARLATDTRSNEAGKEEHQDERAQDHESLLPAISMSQYVQQARSVLMSTAPNFMELNHINALPVGFGDAIQKARTGVGGKVAGLASTYMLDDDVQRPAATAGSHVVSAISTDARLTFSYLLLQLHGRGGQLFWRETRPEDIFAFIALQVVNIYAGILAQIEVEVDGFHYAALAMERICSIQTIDTWRILYAGLRVEILKQRKRKKLNWSPTQTDLHDVFQTYADAGTLQCVTRAATWGRGGVAVAAVLVSLGIVWLRSRP